MYSPYSIVPTIISTNEPFFLLVRCLSGTDAEVIRVVVLLVCRIELKEVLSTKERPWRSIIHGDWHVLL